MKISVDSIMEDDHHSLAELLAKLEEAIDKPEATRAFALLDRFWARLAVHIRAENLQLFPALANVATNRFTGRDGLPNYDEARKTVGRLRDDHDFFMKELALAIKAMRTSPANREEVKDLRRRLTGVKERLEAHNLLEEQQVYVWPALLFDEQTLAKLCDRLRHELNNLPPRFS
jgi:hypothetical protein